VNFAISLDEKGAGYKLATAMTLMILSCSRLTNLLSQWSECWDGKDLVIRPIFSENANKPVSDHCRTIEDR